MAKLTKEQERLQDLFLGEYLRLGDISKLDTKNPFDGRSRDDIENPHVFLLKLMMDPKYFSLTCKYIFNIELAPFQLVILQELWQRKYPMLIASRGASKSYLLALYSMLRGLFHQGCKIIIVGAAFRQAKVIFEYCETIWHNAPVLRDLVGGHIRSGPRRDIDRCTCTLGESVIVALPLGDGTKIRGQRANYIIADEFASIPKEIYENVVSGFAAVSSSPIESMKSSARIRVLKSLGMIANDNQEDSGYGNQAILSGTAYYAFNHFADYWKQYKTIIETKGDQKKLEEIFQGEVPPKFDWRDFSVIRLPVKLLPEGFMDEKHVARSKATVHAGIYNMEFGAIFATDSNGFYKRSLIESCVTSNDIEINGMLIKFSATIYGNPKKRYVFGIDPASEQDKFSIVILELNETHNRVVYGWTTTRAAHKEKMNAGLVSTKDFYGYCARKIRQLMKTFPCERMAIDSQGGGVAVIEALHDPDKMEGKEEPIWPIIEDNKEKDTDGLPGLHIIEVVDFANAKYTHMANHGMRKDFEDKVLLFPFFDSLSSALALEQDKHEKRLHDTLEDCIMEIEELKDELATIVHTQTGQQGRDHWDTPEVKLPGNKKGRLRKDRYSSLLMANMTARTLARALDAPEYKPVGVVAGLHEKFSGALYVGPSGFTEAIAQCGVYGKVISRR